MLEKVAVLVMPGVVPFDFGVLCEVFGVDRRDTGGPAFDFSIVTADPGLVPTSFGFGMMVELGLDAAADADLIAVPAQDLERVDERYLEVIRAAEERGAWVLSVCTGAFVLATAGVLDGRRATTHWKHATQLAHEHPSVAVDPGVLFVEDRRVITSAGTAAGIDACLHLLRLELGATVANAVARRMVVPPQRDGGQSQYIESPIAECRSDSFAPVADWMLANLDRELTVNELARKALMSPRTFARRFRSDMGTTPAAWLNRQRLMRAQQLLEQTDSTIDAIASQTGFGTAAVMRHHFVRVLQTTPAAYRRTFGERASASGTAATPVEPVEPVAVERAAG